VSEEANLFAQQEANRRRSRWLVIGFILFFAWVGFGGDLAFYLMTAEAGSGSYHHVVPYIGIIATLGAGVICWYAWRFGPEKVLWATGAWELVEPATPEQKQLVNVVEEMAIASGLRKPRVWMVPDADPNAFATGRDAASASIAVTEGLLTKLSRDELQAVVAHEMAHIRNLDVRLMTLLAGMVGADDRSGWQSRCALVRWARGRQQRWQGRQPPWDCHSGTLAAHAAGGADGLPAAGHGGESKAGVSRRRYGGTTDAPPGSACGSAGEARRGPSRNAIHHPRRGASLHCGSGTRGTGFEGGVPGRFPWLAPADPAAYHPASG
jgi:hypothetical protein